MVTGKIDRHGRPHVASLAIAVKQDYGGSSTTQTYMNGGPVGCHLPCTEFRWKFERLHHDLHSATMHWPHRASEQGSYIKPVQLAHSLNAARSNPNGRL